jgi:cbb3-type cytochrome oxidase subunit 3
MHDDMGKTRLTGIITATRLLELACIVLLIATFLGRASVSADGSEIGDAMTDSFARTWQTLSVAIISICGAYIAYKTRALAIWRETAQALEARCAALEVSLSEEREKRTALEAQVATLSQKTDITPLLELMTKHHDTVTKLLEDICVRK